MTRVFAIQLPCDHFLVIGSFDCQPFRLVASFQTTDGSDHEEKEKRNFFFWVQFSLGPKKRKKADQRAQTRKGKVLIAAVRLIPFFDPSGS